MGIRGKRIVHVALFAVFVVSALASLAIWLVTRDLGVSGFVATIAAFAATASAFVERLFPQDG